MKGLTYYHPDKSNQDKPSTIHNQASKTSMFLEIKAIIKDSSVENIKQIALFFYNSNTDLLQIVQKDLRNIKDNEEINETLINNWTINPKNIRRKFEILNFEVIKLIIKDFNKKEIKIDEIFWGWIIDPSQ